MIRIIYILATIMIGFASNAQDLEKSLLWKISGNGLEKPSYLFGTMHAVCEINFDEKLKKALDETTQMYLEIDMDDPKLQVKMMKRMMLTDSITLSSLMREEDAKIVDAFLKSNTGISLKGFNMYKPLMISSMLIPKMLNCPMKTVETELIKISKEQNEEIYGLETIEDQLDVFDKIPLQIQIDELVKTAKDNMVKDKTEIQKMLSVYKSEDIEAMLNMMDESENKISSDFNAILLVERNKNWIAVIEKTSKEKPTFYGVGAAHLAGENGVIKLLRKKGYKVEAVK